VAVQVHYPGQKQSLNAQSRSLGDLDIDINPRTGGGLLVYVGVTCLVIRAEVKVKASPDISFVHELVHLARSQFGFEIQAEELLHGI